MKQENPSKAFRTLFIGTIWLRILGGFMKFFAVATGAAALLTACTPGYQAPVYSPTTRVAPAYTSPPVLRETRPASETELAVILEGVAYDMRDPDSVRIREVVLDLGIDRGQVSSGVCGQMNGKNAYGAYTGFQPFMGLLQRQREEKMKFVPVTIGSPRDVAAQMCASVGMPKG